MRLKKRVAKLEKEVRQQTCAHCWDKVKIGWSGASVSVESTCILCGLRRERRGGTNKEIANAYLVLKDLFDDIVRKPVIKQESDKQKGTKQ